MAAKVAQMIAGVPYEAEGQLVVVGEDRVGDLGDVLAGGLDEGGDRVGRGSGVHRAEQVTDVFQGHRPVDGGGGRGQRGVPGCGGGRAGVRVEGSELGRDPGVSGGADEAGDAFVDPPGAGGHQGHGQAGVRDVVGEGVEPMLRVEVRFIVAGDGEGFHGCGEGGPDRLLRYREPLAEQKQCHVVGTLTPAAVTGEAEDEVEALRRRPGGAALAAAQASAGDVPGSSRRLLQTSSIFAVTVNPCRKAWSSSS
ncbi:hypothetical protein ACFXPT_37365 [Streptomyces goshikiensis]|uniref:hypothetical protein n=1 Tax=Streptomyces goshikiensis TaxID=1942 RepID=UPI003687A3EF